MPLSVRAQRLEKPTIKRPMDLVFYDDEMDYIKPTMKKAGDKLMLTFPKGETFILPKITENYTEYMSELQQCLSAGDKLKSAVYMYGLKLIYESPGLFNVPHIESSNNFKATKQ